MKVKENDIKPSLDLEQLSKFICKEYKIRSYLGNSLIYKDYDNFSYILESKTKKYFVRVYNSKKDERDIQSFVEKYRIIEESFKKAPRILRHKDKEIFKVILDNFEKVYVMVMEFYPGNNLLKENVTITKNDLDQIVKYLDDLKNIKLKNEVNNLSFSNLKNNLKKYNEYVPHKWNDDISKCLDAIKRLNNKEMKKQTIHGDLHAANVLKHDDILSFVDYENAGLGYRLIDVVKVISNIIYTVKNKKQAEELCDYFVETYEKKNVLTKTEKDNLYILVMADCYNNLCLNRYLLKERNNKLLKYWYKNDLRVIKILKKKI